MPASPVLLNHRRDCAISRERKTDTLYETRVKKIVLSADGYNDRQIEQTYHCVNEKVFDGCDIKLLLMGVSFDAIDYRNDDGSNEDGGTVTTALIEKYMRMGGQDTGTNRKFLSVGTCGHGFGDTFEYKGVALNCRGRHEARGGHNGINYLRQPIPFSPTNIDYDPNVNGSTATGAVMWYMCGLRYRVPYNRDYTTSGEDFGEFTINNVKCLRHTPFGKYHHDYSEALWKFCNQKKWISAVGEEYSEWTGSDSQKQIIDKCMEHIATNPDYPWYDRDTARETSYADGAPKDVNDNSQYALNLDTYIKRCRTMDDNGVRLESSSANPAGEEVQGSDGKTYRIGSRITTQYRLTNYDVCQPTHIIWDMCFNDWTFYYGTDERGLGAGGEDSVALAELFISAAKKQLGENIRFGLKSQKPNGCMFPNQWGDIALAQGFNPNECGLTTYNRLVIEKYSDLSKSVSWIPCYPVSIPFATNFSQRFEDFVYGSCLVQSGDTYSVTSDVTHEGLRCAKAMAYQIYGWLGYLLKQS